MHAAALVLAATPLTGAAAQAVDPAMIEAERAAIAKLSWMDGTWRGPAVTQSPAASTRSPRPNGSAISWAARSR